MLLQLWSLLSVVIMFEFVFNLKFKSQMDSIRQRVYLAAELLSRTVANALEIMYPNDTKMTNLSKFIRLIDLWFDVFNRLVFVAFHFSNLLHKSNITWKCKISIQDTKSNFPTISICISFIWNHFTPNCLQ